MAGRVIYGKQVADERPVHFTAVCGNAWTAIGVLLFCLFSRDNLAGIDLSVVSNYKFYLLSAIKGLLFVFVSILLHRVRQKSVSTSLFGLPLALGLAAFINSFLGESLSGLQFAAIIGLAAVSLVFMLKGHVREVGKISELFGLIGIITFMIVSDHYVISNIGWFKHLFFTWISGGVFTLLYSIVIRHNWRDYVTSFTDRACVLYGIACVMGEILVIYAMVNIMPVSIVVFFIQLNIPLLMVYSAYKWDEGVKTEQALYGGLMLLFAVPIIFGS